MVRLPSIRAWLTAAAFCLLAAPVLASSASVPDIDDDDQYGRIVVRESHHFAEVVLSVPDNPTPHVLRMPRRPISVALLDVNHDGHLDFSALLPGQRLLVWLNYGKEGFSRLRSRMRWRFVRRAASARHIEIYTPFVTRHVPDKDSSPAGQATPPTPVLLDDSFHRHAPTAVAAFRVLEEARVPFGDRSDPHPSRAPPADLVN